jgi:alpha-amylase/alpha-mannosidase (GH57 family)
MRYVCVHGHFYQPPRENPSLEAIELQDSAYPYHDWNERVTAECYAPNAVSRLLDGQHRIVKLTNNYSTISFNFGPTLLSWLEAKSPSVNRAIVEADGLSQQAFSGHGSAVAQAYNHMIIPLANRRDKVTQVRWGIRDFEHRFGRRPEGMWLPETAVDVETLGILAAHGIRFTILAPRQARRVRRHGSRSWKDVSGDRIDPSRAYLCRLPSRQSINLFFYDGPISQAVAFEGLLNDGGRFADRLMSGFSDERTWPQLVHIATDGESYGHHHRFGEMALTYALHHIQSNQLAELTNYGQYLERHPADHFVEIFDNSSWSCVHGVERWRSNCGCNSGGHSGWNQEWRAPLRAALDWLRDTLAGPYAEKASTLLKDAWGARDKYIDVILDRSAKNMDRFLGDQATHPLDEQEKITALKLLELQRHALLMYTSCGWFFDELSGIETVQVIHYAGRVVQLAQELFGGQIESDFVERLKTAKSNLPEHGDGAQIYEKWVKPANVDMTKLAAHYAISSVFEPYSDHTRIYCYDVDREEYNTNTEGKMRLVIGRARFTSKITHDASSFSFGALHVGDHNVRCGVRPFNDHEDYQGLVKGLTEAFGKADTTEVTRLLEAGFGEHIYSLRSLFRDEQRKIVSLVLEDTLAEAAAAFRNIYENHAPLIRFLNSLGIPLPRAFQAAAEVALNSNLRQAFKRPELDLEGIRSLLKEAANMNVPLDVQTLEYVIRRRVEAGTAQLASQPEDPEIVRKLNRLLDLIRSLPFQVNLWEAQNAAYGWLSKPKSESESQPVSEEDASIAKSWAQETASLREKLDLQNP